MTPRGAEGNYLFIDKNLVELCALLALMFVPTGKFMGIDGLIANFRSRRRDRGEAQSAGISREHAEPLPRRAWLRHFATVPVAGGFAFAFGRKHGWPSFEEEHLLARMDSVDGLTSATMKQFEFARLDDLKGAIPHGKIAISEPAG